MSNSVKALTRGAICILGLAALAGCMGDLGLGGIFGPIDIETRDVWVRFEGLVSAAEDGRPLAGASVEEPLRLGLSGLAIRATTDAEGRYSLLVREECGAYGSCWTPSLQLVAHLHGFRAGRAPRMVQAASHLIPSGADTVTVKVDFALPPTRPITLTVEGRVRSLTSRQAVEGATVVISWNEDLPFFLPEPSTLTDAEGRYSVSSEHFCAISGSRCSASFEVRAVWMSEPSYELFRSVHFEGDVLGLGVDFEI